MGVWIGEEALHRNSQLSGWNFNHSLLSTLGEPKHCPWGHWSDMPERSESLEVKDSCWNSWSGQFDVIESNLRCNAWHAFGFLFSFYCGRSGLKGSWRLPRLSHSPVPQVRERSHFSGSPHVHLMCVLRCFHSRCVLWAETNVYCLALASPIQEGIFSFQVSDQPYLSLHFLAGTWTRYDWSLVVTALRGKLEILFIPSEAGISLWLCHQILLKAQPRWQCCLGDTEWLGSPPLVAFGFLPLTKGNNPFTKYLLSAQSRNFLGGTLWLIIEEFTFRHHIYLMCVCLWGRGFRTNDSSSFQGQCGDS